MTEPRVRTKQDTDLQQKIRPIYADLIGQLSGLPQTRELFDTFNRNIADHYNTRVDELSRETVKDFGSYKVEIKEQRFEHVRTATITISIVELRQKMNGLIMRLHAEYFDDEDPPFGGQPGTINVMKQEQAQAMSISFLLNLQEHVLQRAQQVDEGSTERKLLDRIKEKLRNVSDGLEGVKAIIDAARIVGASVDDIRRALFG